jgi:hypothetical protein
VNWTELQAQTAGWVDRSDLTALMPVFLDNAEARIYSGIPDGPLRCRGLRLQSMLLTAAAVATPWTLPAGLLSIHNVTAQVGGYAKQLDPAVSDTAAPYLGMPGDPQGYLVRGGTLQLVGIGPGAATIVYYGRLTTPSAGGDTNAIMTTYSGVYRWAMLAEAADYLQNAEASALYSGRFAEAMKSAQAQDDRLRNDGPITIRNRAGGVRV